ncbi:RGT2 High glucose sensor RGT2 [Candida maltosa Xu316]
MFEFLNQFKHNEYLTDEERIRKKRKRSGTYKIGLVTAMGGFLYGYDTGLINDLLEMEYVFTHFPRNGVGFTTHERAIIVAILSLGTFIGALLAPWISDKYGRRFCILISSGLFFNIGNILQISAAEVALLIVGRFMSGLALGILSATVPLYLGESSTKETRGRHVFFYQFLITFSLLVSSAVCQGTRKIQNSGSYRIPIGLQFLWASILFFGMLFLPDSPRFYVQKDDLQKALESLCKLRRLPPDDEEIIEELVDIKANYDYEKSFGKTTVWDCFRSGGGRHKQGLRMLTGIGIQFFQQCSGINFIFYYGVNFFLSTGINNYYLMSFITYLVNVVFTIPGIMLIDIVGRRPLLFWGGVGMSISNFIIAIAGVSVNQQEVNAILCVSFACVFIAFFASTWGGSTWAVCSDIFGISIRQKAFSITTATNWIVNFVFAYITPYLIDSGNHTAAIGRLKLEEVDYMYAHCSNARVSYLFKSTKIDFAHLDENYNPIPNTAADQHAPDSTTSSNELYHDKQSNEMPYPVQTYELQPLYHGKEQNDLTIIPYNNELSPSSTISTNDEHERRRSILSDREFSSNASSRSKAATYRTKSQTSAVSNDYQQYLQSIKKEYSQHYQNSSSIIKQLSRTSNSNNNNSNISQTHGSFEQERKPSINDNPLSMNNIPTTIIAAPFFDQPPSDSDSDSNDEEEEEDNNRL